MKWAVGWFVVAAAAVVYVFWVLADAGTFALEDLASGTKWQAIFGGVVAALSLGLAFVNDIESRPDPEVAPHH
ncbi:hypothetical protein [Actinocorallia longicatena]|uniref:Uncharacterized protein n=1 Tax=Actinocorallia longicatena TaxID=111803 RepID=A0ABP6QJD2_9ACTN